MSQPIKEGRGRYHLAGGWVPILAPGDPYVDTAWDAVSGIVESIRRRTYLHGSNDNPKRDYRPYEEPLLYGYMSLATDDICWQDRATESLNEAIDNAHLLARRLGLFGGLCGLGWVVEHLSNVLAPGTEGSESGGDVEEDVEESADLTSEIDDALVAALLASSWKGRSYDLISGLVGFGIYFLERLPRKSAEDGVKLVVNHLKVLAEHTESGTCWHSGPELLPEWQRALCPEGYYNIGVAHGIPGVLFFLAEVWTAGIERDIVLPLLEDALNWFIGHKRKSGVGSWFSSWIGMRGESPDTRATWCYGDLGILAVLIQIASRVPHKELQTFAYSLLDHCVTSPIDSKRVVDAPLCHGAIGNAHVFNRLFQSTGDERCRNEALKWIQFGLQMRRSTGGVGGFFLLTKPDPVGPSVWEPSPAFLDGGNGIALGLLAALTSVEPQWDRVMLLSGRAFPEVSLSSLPDCGEASRCK